MIKKSLSLCLSIVLVLSLCFCLPVSASVTSGCPHLQKSYSTYKMPNKNAVCQVQLYNVHSFSEIKNLKSSNSQVKATLINGFYGPNIKLTSSSFTGTTTISYKFHGKTYSFKYTVISYYNPAKLFKIGNTRYTHGFNSTNKITSRSAKINKTLQIDAKTGWIITKVTVVSTGGKNSETKYYYPKTSSFSKKITLYTAAHTVLSYNNYIKIEYKHKRTGKTISQFFCIQ